MSRCQKCMREIPDGEARWMYTPELPLKARFDKCQPCGPWTSGEQAVATHKVMGAMQQRQQAGNQATSGCNCTGKR